MERDQRDSGQIRPRWHAAEVFRESPDVVGHARWVCLRGRPWLRPDPGLYRAREIHEGVQRSAGNARPRIDRRTYVLSAPRTTLHLRFRYHEQRGVDREPGGRHDTRPLWILRPQRRGLSLASHGGDRYAWERLYRRGGYREARSEVPGGAVEVPALGVSARPTPRRLPYRRQLGDYPAFAGTRTTSV